MHHTMLPYRNPITEWSDRYEMAEFGRFIYLWLSFNARFSQTLNKSTDREKIEWFSESMLEEIAEPLQSNLGLSEAFIGSLEIQS